VQKLLTSPAPQPVAQEKRRKGDDTEKGRAGIPPPFRDAARRVTINLRRIARAVFRPGKALMMQRAPPSADAIACLPDPPDSMNPFCAPDAFLAGFDGDCGPPQNYGAFNL
jgi:hypothetical protein